MGKTLRMNILLTNDDGIHAPGLRALYEALSPAHRVSVVAPETEQSAAGHAVTLTDPIRVNEVQVDGRFYGYAVDGTPADCVKIALFELLKDRPDAVVSGINLGANVGINLLYSGTVSAATEGAILGLPAVAVSLATYAQPDFGYAAEFTASLVARLPELDLAPYVCLNVNVPALPRDRISGVSWVKQCQVGIRERFSRRHDPRGKVYFWYETEGPIVAPELDTDVSQLARQKITITPINHDLTHYEELDRLSRFKLDP
jgi:5'-nucleotidase